MRKYQYNKTEYIVNSQYTKERTLDNILEEIILNRYNKKYDKT